MWIVHTKKSKCVVGISQEPAVLVLMAVSVIDVAVHQLPVRTSRGSPMLMQERLKDPFSFFVLERVAHLHSNLPSKQ